jgi:RNA polymerase sigma factor (sigma-70 family)
MGRVGRLLGGLVMTSLTPERQALAADYLPIATKLASRHSAKRPHLRGDIAACASLATCQAAALYDPTRPVKFSSFAHTRVVGAILDAIRMDRNGGLTDIPHSMRFDPDRPRCSAQGEYFDAVDHRRPEIDVIADAEDAADAAEQLLGRLPAECSIPLRFHYLRGWSRPEIATLMGEPRIAISGVVAAARRFVAEASPVVHIETHIFPGRPGCGRAPNDSPIHPHHARRPDRADWCPECLRITLDLERAEARAKARLTRQPQPR